MTTTTNYQTITPANEQEFICWLQGDDERQFSKLYDRFSAAVFGLILKWMQDEGTAENLLQDVFVKAWRCRHLYDASKGRLFTWLHNIARNICIDHMRSKAYKKSKSSLLSDNLSELVTARNTENFLPDTIGLRNLIRILRNEEKEVVELMYFKGMTQKEIAVRMDIPVGTVKTRISRAIKNLRYFFTKDWDNGTEAISLN
jgi:RNA polymerase sigma-70 factor (ECF subfamily)